MPSRNARIAHSTRSAAIGSSLRRAPGGQEAEDRADGDARRDGDARATPALGIIGDDEDAADADRDRAADDDAEDAADHRQDDRLDEELHEDVPLARADRHADADLARPLGDAHEHDVHDADAADEQADHRDAEREQRERPEDRVRRLAELGLRVDDEVLAPALDAVALAEDALDLRLGARRSSDRSSR